MNVVDFESAKSKPATSHEEIIRIAILVNATKEDGGGVLARELEKLDSDSSILVLLASKLLAGGKFGFGGAPEKIIARARSLARHLGGSVDIAEFDGRTEVLFSPPPRQ